MALATAGHLEDRINVGMAVDLLMDLVVTTLTLTSLMSGTQVDQSIVILASPSAALVQSKTGRK